MKMKVSAIVSDLVLVVLVIGGAIWLFLQGTPADKWQSDAALLPQVVDWSRILIYLTAAAVVLGLIVAMVRRRGRDRVTGGDVVRYDGYQRLVHWSLAIGFILAFVTGAWLLRLFGLQTTVDIRPTLYVIHFIGAGLIVLGGVTYATSSQTRGEDALFPRWKDVGPAIARLFGYLGIYGESGVFGLRLRSKGLAEALASIGIKPEKRPGKFLAVEKVFSFTPLAILATIVIATGLIKTARYFFTINTDVMYWTTWLHDLSVWLTLIVVGAHLAAIFLVPRNWPGVGAMLGGRISLRHAREEFPAWTDELGQPERGAPPEGAPAPGTVGD